MVQSQPGLAGRSRQSPPTLTLVPLYLVDGTGPGEDGLAALLASWGYSLRHFASGEQFIARASYLVPGIVLLNENLPGMSGSQTHDLIALNHAFHQVIFCLSQPDVPKTVSALRRGAHDVLVRPFENAALAASLAETAALLTDTSSRLRDQQDARQRLGLLNDRERSVLEGVIAGHSNKEMARQMDISHRTVEIHRARLMRKLAADTVGDLFRVATTAGIMGD